MACPRPAVPSHRLIQTCATSSTASSSYPEDQTGCRRPGSRGTDGRRNPPGRRCDVGHDHLDPRGACRGHAPADENGPQVNRAGQRVTGDPPMQGRATHFPPPRLRQPRPHRPAPPALASPETAHHLAADPTPQHPAVTSNQSSPLTAVGAKARHVRVTHHGHDEQGVSSRSRLHVCPKSPARVTLRAHDRDASESWHVGARTVRAVLNDRYAVSGRRCVAPIMWCSARSLVRAN